MRIDATAHGFVGDGVTLHTGEQLRDLVNFAVAQKAGAGGVTIHFPAGSYRFTSTALIQQAAYTFYRLRIEGDGKSQTVFHAEDGAELLHFTNSSGYSAELSIRGIGFFGSRAALRVQNFYYSEIVDCGFRGCGSDSSYAIHLEGNTGKVRIDDIWAYHGGDLLFVQNGSVVLTNSQIGEDVGEICVTGYLRAVGVTWDSDVYNRVVRPMGRAAVMVTNRSRAHFVGCSASVLAGNAFVNFHQAEHVAMDGCAFVLLGGSIVRNHWMGYGRGVSINGGYVQVRSPSSLWARHANVAPTDSSIRGLRITLDDYDSCDVDDAFFEPTRRNVYADNLVTWKV